MNQHDHRPIWVGGVGGSVRATCPEHLWARLSRTNEVVGSAR